MSTLAFPVVEGEITQVEHDEQGRITVLHVRERSGHEDEIRISYPDEPDPVTLTDDYAVVSLRSRRPEVSVVRLA